MTTKTTDETEMKSNDPPKVRALSASDILSQEVTLALQWVDVPEWKGGVWVRELTGIERDRFEQSLVKGRGTKRRVDLSGSRARLVQMGTIEGTSPEEPGHLPPNPRTAKRLFTPQDIKRLSDLGAKPLERVAETVRLLSGITEGDDEDSEGRDLGNSQNGNSGFY